jgi:hypothetical protein
VAQDSQSRLLTVGRTRRIVRARARKRPCFKSGMDALWRVKVPKFCSACLCLEVWSYAANGISSPEMISAETASAGRVAHTTRFSLCGKLGSFDRRVPHSFAYCAKGWEAETWWEAQTWFPFSRISIPKDKGPMFPPLQRTQGWGTISRGILRQKKGRATRPLQKRFKKPRQQHKANPTHAPLKPESGLSGPPFQL